ncbi:hypothetical protein [Virgibacillus sp. YIM 98842]|uniref:hypothetical protein n=1 Tax=Virgibacillus sp. YIM 98842 TaxID=2663533 RepID=UPI0013DB97E7|nr:hypothetical protein [Virgibacillus sp. YIM 98842]
MLKSKIVLGVFILFLLGGCNVLGQKDISEMDPAELPDVIAFQDDFTREFMSSLEEVEDGYYLFESKTGGYTMMYPENAKMDQLFYESTGDNYEYIQFGENEETNNYTYYVRATYNAGSIASDLRGLQGILAAHTGYEGDYEASEYEDKTIHFATTEYVTQSGESTTNRFLVIVMSNDSDQAVSIRYNVISDNNKDNNINLNNIKKEVMSIMESIEFKMEE